MRPLTLARSKTFPPVSAHQRERAWSRTGYGQPHTGSRGSVHYNAPARLTCPASERNRRTRRADATCRCRGALRSRSPAHGRSQRRPAPQKAAVVRLCVPGVWPPRRVAGSWSLVSGGHAVTQRGEQAGKGGGEADTDVCQRGFLRVQARQHLRGMSGWPERIGESARAHRPGGARAAHDEVVGATWRSDDGHDTHLNRQHPSCPTSHLDQSDLFRRYGGVVELRQLEHFVAVAGEMNFTRAAQRAHVVQSALSTSIAKLERELGVALFDRSRQQIRLTAAGERFRAHTYEVLRTSRAAAESVGEFRGSLSGTVEFGSLISFGPMDVARALGDFHRAHPFVRLRLRLSQSGASAYLAALVEGSLDLALVSVPDRFPVNLEMRLFSRSTWFSC